VEMVDMLQPLIYQAKVIQYDFGDRTLTLSQLFCLLEKLS
jgi:hypothetical protein